MSFLSALLTQDKVVTPRKIDEAIQRQVISGGDFETNLLEVNAVAEDCLAGYAAIIRDMLPARRAEVVEASLDLIARAPRALLETVGAFPLRVEGGVALIAVSEPLTDDASRDLARAFGVPVEGRYVSPARVAWAHNHHFDTPLPSRTRRLVERLASLDPGDLPTRQASPKPRSGPRPAQGAASALATLDAALRDDDEVRAPSMPAPPMPSAATADAHQAPTSRPAPASEYPALKTIRVGAMPRAMSSDPPSTRPLPPQRREGDLISLRAARVPDARDLLGERSLDLDEARAILAESSDRESVVDAMLDHAAQHFGYVALFAVHGDEVSGVAARGPGVVGAPLRGLGFSLRGDGALARAASEGRVSRADPNGADRAVAETLRRPTVSHPRVFPLRLRSKVALLLWADDGERIPSEVAVTALESFLVECAAAFTRLILAKKRASRPAPGAASPSSLGPFPTLAPRRATIPSVEVRAAALRGALLVGERRSAAPPRRSQPPASAAPEPLPTQPEPPRQPATVGEADLAALLGKFPGKHSITRSASGSRLPVASEQGPILAAMVALGPAAVPGLLPILADPDPSRRYCALLCLAEVLDPSAIPAISALLTDVDYPTRMAAIEVLRRYRAMPEIDAVWPVLRATIRDARATVEARRAAAHAAGELRDSGAVSVLIATLSERDAALVAATRRALVELSRQDFGVDAPRWLAWWSEASSRHRAEWLIDALTHADATIRHEAAEELKALSGQVFGYYFNLPRKERERAQQRYRDWWQREGAATLAGRASVDG